MEGAGHACAQIRIDPTTTTGQWTENDHDDDEDDDVLVFWYQNISSRTFLLWFNKTFILFVDYDYRGF